MKIYKQNVEELLQEAVGPIYLMRTVTTKIKEGAKLYILNVTAFNSAGKVVALTILAGDTLPFEHSLNLIDLCAKLEKECRQVIVAAGFDALPGYIHDEIVWGDPDGYMKGFQIERKLEPGDFTPLDREENPSPTLPLAGESKEGGVG